jgi:N-acetylneuraminic acid mutarotase
MIKAGELVLNSALSPSSTLSFPQVPDSFNGVPKAAIASSWVAAGALATARGGHTATLLANGKVLVAGGTGNNNVTLASAEVYDRVTNTWTSTGAMTIARSDHAAFLLSGKVVVVGGSTPLSAESFDPTTGTWTAGGQSTGTRTGFTATALTNGKILVVGGDGTGSAIIYDPVAKTWGSMSLLNTPRSYHTATLLTNGKVLVAGGYNAGYLKTAELYDPATNLWSATGSMAAVRSKGAALRLPDGQVLVTGGQNTFSNADPYNFLTTTEVYDPATGIWTNKPNMNTARINHAIAVLNNGQVLATGGTKTHYGVSSCNYPNCHLCFSCSNYYGCSGTCAANYYVYNNTAEVFDPTIGTWSTATNMLKARAKYTATLLTNSQILVIGGEQCTGSNCAAANKYINNVELSIFAPATTTQAATNVTTNSATLNGLVNDSGASTTISFQYGLDTNYGTSVIATPATIEAGIGNTNVTSNISGLTCSTTYHYRVKAINSVGTSYGADQTFIPPCLAAPNITSAAAGNAQVSLTWSAVTGAASYNVYQGTSAGGQAATPVKTGITGSSVTITGLTNGTTYYFKMAAVNASGAVSALSNEISARPMPPPPAAPVLATATAGNAQVTLSWSAVTGAATYNVYQGTTAGGQATTPVKTGITAVSVTITGLTNGTTYYFKLAAVNAAGSVSALSNELSARPMLAAIDFVVNKIVLTPAAPVANSTFSAAVTVKNLGQNGGDAGQLGIWLNQPAVVNCGAASNQVQTIGSLSAGASKTFTFTGLAAGASGIKTLRAFVDKACTTTETNDSNNQLALSYRVTGRLPDFVITNAILAPASPVVNSDFTVTLTIKNQGTMLGTGFVDVWNSVPASLVCGLEGNAWGDLGLMNPGATKVLTFTLPADSVAGTKTMLAFVDSWCETAEFDEGNNKSTPTYTVLAALPDFLVTNIALTPTTPQAGGTFDIAVTVKNQANFAGSGGQLMLWMDEPTEQTCGGFGDALLPVGTVAAGASKVFNFVGFEAGVAGSRTLRTFVDYTCIASEANETNNQMIQAYTVQ